MNRYENGKIYKVSDVAYTECYIGSTCESLNQRMARHRQEYNRFLQGKRRNITIFKLFETYGVENCKIELIENFACNSIEELIKREGEYIKNTECVNRTIPGRTSKEWKPENPEKIRQYYNDNRDEILERSLQRYYNNRDDILEKRQEKVECPFCKCQVFKHYLPIRNKSKAHLKNMETTT